jgi:hypothetical protein
MDNERTVAFMVFFSKIVFPLKVTPSQMDMIRRWQKGDNTAYQHYVNKFSALVEAEGEGFQQEVAHLEHVIANLTQFCADVKAVMLDTMPRNFSKQRLGWNDFVMLSKDEVVTLRKQRDPHVLGRKEMIVARSEYNEEFSLTKDDCRMLKMTEMPLHQLLVYKTREKRKEMGYVEKRTKIP